MVSTAAAYEVYPQGGLEIYFGTNHLSQLTPWVAVRLGISGRASFILKYYNHNLRYNYLSFDETSEEFAEKKRVARISNFTSILYYQKDRLTAYGAVSLLFGTDSYNGLALDAGVGQKISKRIAIEGGIYLLREDSILWFPEEEKRNINLYSLKGSLKFEIIKGLYFNPNLYLYQNSEDVNALSFSFGFILNPKDPTYITIYYYRYKESAQYRFSGNYISAGLNFYF